MPLTILSIAYPLMPVGPHASGGSEQILSIVEQGIVEAGHRSIVISAKGSVVRGELIETETWEGEICAEMQRRARANHLAAIQKMLATNSIDLIHFHGLDFHCYVPKTGIPMLATLHLPLSFYPTAIFDSFCVSMNFVSETQRTTCRVARNWPVIPNGVNVPDYECSAKRDDYALVIARICPEKGIHFALQAAHQCGSKLYVVGPVHPYPAHLKYFDSVVRPLLDDDRVYLGPADLSKKRALLSKANCLIVPSTVEETSSLVSMEALAAGTPVIAFRSGALPEIVRDGVTGFIVDSVDGIGEALKKVRDIDPFVCRREAEERFSARVMITKYLRLYQALADRSRACSDTDTTHDVHPGFAASGSATSP